MQNQSHLTGNANGEPTNTNKNVTDQTGGIITKSKSSVTVRMTSPKIVTMTASRS